MVKWLLIERTTEGLFTLNNSITINVTLRGGTFDLFNGHCGGKNGLHNHFARHRNVCDGVAWREQTLRAQPEVVFSAYHHQSRVFSSPSKPPAKKLNRFFIIFRTSEGEDHGSDGCGCGRERGVYPGPTAAPRRHQPPVPAALSPRRRQGGVPRRVYRAHDGRLLREVRNTQTTAQTWVGWKFIFFLSFKIIGHLLWTFWWTLILLF